MTTRHRESTRLCDSCDTQQPTTAYRDNREFQCDPCWRDALAHGHSHGMHDTPLAECPLCPDANAHTDDELTTCPHCGSAFLYWQADDHRRSCHAEPEKRED